MTTPICPSDGPVPEPVKGFCYSCAMHVQNAGHARDCLIGQMEHRDARIAALEAEVAKMSTALGLVVGRVFPQFEDPEIAKLLEKMKPPAF
jgi:hypothetical protein